MAEKDTPHILIRRADMTDSRDIWQWRNDEHTRQMSITTDAVDWITHGRWYARSLENPDRHMYIGCLGGTQKIGICRFDVERQNGTAEISINLNPAHRGRRLSTILLQMAIQQFETEGIALLTATIKRVNIPSIRCFTRLGFELVRQESEYNVYRRALALRSIHDPPLGQALRQEAQPLRQAGDGAGGIL